LYQKGNNTEKMQAVPHSEPSESQQAPKLPPQGKDGPVIVLFHATWCPHCKDVLPIWQQLKAGAKGNIQVLDIESKDPALTQHQIPGFPTIRFFPQGLGSPQDHKDYTGPRTLEGIIQFLSSL
jgi:thioredoxin-like negative regulator of GroEL